MTKNFYTWILKGGVLAAFIIPFFVFDNLLFPYITSKQIPFNILIEVLAIFWVALIVKYPDYRPKRNWITYGLLGFFLALTVSALVGVDFSMSFWGNIERMLGVFHLYHFLMLFLIIITVFRNELDWQLLIMALVISAGLEGLYAVSIYPTNNYGHLGNSSYTSGQMIFALFFAAYLMYKQKHIAARLGYGFLSIFMFIAFVNAGTRGAQVGLLAGVALIALMMAAMSKRKEIKIGSVSLVAVLVIGVSLIFSNANAGWVQSNKLFSRIAQINFQASTFQTRLISWKAAFKGIPEHPFFGTGYGNFAITFDKYLDPKFFTYEQTYFDHAHNNLVDILATVGIVGLIAYLLIFPGVIYYIYKAYKNGNISSFEFALFYGLLAAYFIQNIVLFDSFITYLALMVFLGLAYYVHFKNDMAVNNPNQGTTAREYLAWGVMGVLMLSITYNYNIRPWQMLIDSIGAQVAMAQTGDIVRTYDLYRAALSEGTILDRQSRSSFAQVVMQNSAALGKLDNAKTNEIYDYTIGELEKNLSLNPKDSFTHMLLSSLLSQAASVNAQQNNRQQASAYISMAQSEVDKAIASNPARPSNYYIKAQIAMSTGKRDEALTILKQAESLNPEYGEAVCQYARTLAAVKPKDKQVSSELDSCIDKNGAKYLDQNTVNDLLKRYEKASDTGRMIKIFEYVSSVQTTDGRVYASLAELYRRNGEIDKAISAARTAGDKDPSLRASAEQFIQKLQK